MQKNIQTNKRTQLIRNLYRIVDSFGCLRERAVVLLYTKMFVSVPFLGDMKLDEIFPPIYRPKAELGLH